MRIKPEIVTRQIKCTGNTLPNDMHAVLQRIYLARDVSDLKQTENKLNHLLVFDDLKDIKKASVMLADYISQKKRILIIGDYDADGATSCALAMRALRAMGASHVDYLVPNRFEYGYGLTPEIVEVAKQRKPDLIVTVDNGIASIEGVEAAKSAGISVLITDHHLPGETLPDADAIVNPNQPGCSFNSKSLAGVGVVFYLMIALRSYLRELDWFKKNNTTEPNLGDYLDLVALGTVADVVKLDHNNRILVAQGLSRIRGGMASPGIQALLKVAGRDYRKVTSMDMGFFVGPRLNAAGRLDEMSIGIECLLAENESEAMQRAGVLDQLNRDRRSIEQTMREQADMHIEKILDSTKENHLPSTLCLYDPEFHEGVIGILAGRIKEQLHRPTIVFAAATNEHIKGSARSIPGLHIRDALDRVATTHPELLSKFGGHAMAAGLTLRKSDFDLFAATFEQIVKDMVSADDLLRVLQSDGELDIQDINLHMAEILRNGGPWGQGFPEPLFEGHFDLVQKRVVGEHHLKMLLKKGDKCVDAIAFRLTDADWPEQVERVKIVYKLDVNEFNGQKNVQLVADYVEPV